MDRADSRKDADMAGGDGDGDGEGEGRKKILGLRRQRQNFKAVCLFDCLPFVTFFGAASKVKQTSLWWWKYEQHVDSADQRHRHFLQNKIELIM